MVTVTANGTQATQGVINLPEFASKDIVVYRRGIGYLKPSEFTTLLSGGFSLQGIEPGETFFVWPNATEVFESIPSVTASVSYGGIQQYPHSVKFLNNNWSSATSSLYTHKGRAETGGSAKKGFNQDDPTVMCIVYLPLPIDSIELGIPVEVYWNNELIVSGPVKQFSRGQLNARIWL